jgi:hypothetical protein
LRIEVTTVSKKGTQGKCHRKEYQERGIENWGKAKSFSRSGEKDVLKYSGEIDGKWKGHRKNELEQDKDLQLSLYFFNGPTDQESADGYQDEPVAEDDSEGEFIAEKRDEKLPQQNDLRGDTAQPHDEKRAFEGSDVHIEVLSSG